MPKRNLGREAEMIMLYRGGATLEEIGGATGLCRERVRQILKRAGEPVVRHHFVRLDRLLAGGGAREQKFLRESGLGQDLKARRRRQAMDRIVKTISALSLELGRSLGLDELGRRLNPAWRHPSVSTQGALRTLWRSSGREATKRAYLMAGCEPPRVGARWLFARAKHRATLEAP